MVSKGRKKLVQVFFLCIMFVLLGKSQVFAASISLNNTTVPSTPNKYMVGDEVKYSMTVTVPLSAYQSTIDVFCIYPDGSKEIFDTQVVLNPGASKTYTRDYVIKDSDVNLTTKRVVNRLQVTGKDSTGGKINSYIDKTSTIVFPALTIDVSGPTHILVGETVNYRFTLKNTGDTNLSLKNITDSLLGDVSTNFPTMLTPGQVVTVNLSRPVTETDLSPIINLVTANYKVEGTTYEHSVTASDDHTVIINNRPLAVNDNERTTEETPVQINVLANDSDIDGDTLTVTEVTQASNGKVTINTDGTVTYTPNANFNGTDTFTYTISDGIGGTATATVTVVIDPVNDAPVAVDDNDTTLENTPVVINVLANDSDIDGDKLTVTEVTQGANGKVTINTDGTVTYTPNANFNGTDTFTYTISDGNGGTATATVTVVIDPVNDAPVAVDDNDTTLENTPVVISVLVNDSDIDGDTLVVTAVTQGANGKVTINTDGTVTYTPNANYNGTDTFTYTISDGNGGTATATVTVVIDPVNDAPVAVDDNDTTLENTPVVINVLSNDSDIDGDTLTVTEVTQGANGKVTINTNGTVTYTPNANFNGTDTFTYTISDGNGGTATATVTVVIDPVNDAPVAVDDNDTTLENTPVVISVLANDSDIDGDTLVVTAVTQGANGKVTINTDGTVTYTPNANYNGTDTFTYTISDGNGGTATATVTVVIDPVNDAPVAVDDNESTLENTPVVINVLANDSDIDGDKLTVTEVTQGADGKVTINNDGTVTYTPNASFNGTDTFTYTISDGNGGTATATVTVVIHPVNDAPVAVDDNDTTLENNPVVINVLSNDSDIDGDTLTVTTVTQGANGKVTINTDGTVTYTPNANYNGTDTFTYTISDGNGGTATATVTVVIDPINDAPVAVDDNDTTLENTPVVINVLSNDSDIDGDTLTVTTVTQGANGKVTINTDGTVTYTPNANYNGTDTFTYTISDGNGGTATATVTVVIDPVNDAPVAVDDNDTTLENTPVVISVLANDSDIDGDKLTVTEVTQGANGKVTINADGTVTYTPNADFNGTDTFTYTISDGNGGTATAVVTVVIDPVNDAPVAVDDNDTTLENTPVVINVLANDSDIDGDKLTVTAITQGANGKVTINTDGTVTYTPNASFNGTDTFTYTISDGNGGTATATVTVVVDPVNDAPVAVDDNDTTLENTPVVISVLANDSDIDGDKLTVTAVTQGANGKVTINTDGTVTYTPNANYNGTDTFTYTISDGNSGTATAVVTVVINPVNDAPVAVDDNDTTLENTPVVINVLANDSDIDGDKLTVTAVTQGANGKVTINPDGTVTYTPNANFNGTDTFTYTISDGNGGNATATVTVVIDPVNDAPVAVDDNDTTLENTPVVINVLANDSDIDGDKLTVTAITQGTNGKVTINTDGTVTYTPNANYNGTDTFTYTISDGNSGTATATVTVVIDPVNDAPVAVDDNESTLENTPVVVNVLANDSDIDGDKLTVTEVTQAANGKVTINTDGTVTYTPNANFNGTDTFTYTISDGNGGTATATVTVIIDPVNDAPVAVDDNDTTAENTPVVINVLANDSDIDGDKLTVTEVAQAANGKVTINTDGTVTYTPNANFNGTDTFTYTISDGNGGTATATVTVVIDPVNDAPVAVDDNDTTLENTPVVINVLSNDSDIDGDKLTVTAVTQGANGKVTINTDGTVTYTPNASFNGTDTFTYTISDGNDGTATATVTVVIDPVNDAPVAVDDNDTTLENTPVVVNVLSNDSDIDGDKLTVTAVTQGANGKVTINTDGTVTYTPNANFNGTDTFTYTISDGNGGTATATVTVVIDPVNDAPVAVDDNDTTLENTPVVINVLSNDSDIDGDTLTVTTVTQGANGKVTINTDGTVTYTPNASFNGTDTFTYTISDGNGGTATATVTVVIDPVNDAPVAVDDNESTLENTPVVINVLANDSDIDGDKLTVTAVTQGANGKVTINTDGTVTYTPNANFNGTDTFTYTISDGNGGTATATVTVVIDPVNDAPVAVDDNDTTLENTPVVINVLANDSDIDGDKLTVTTVTQGANGKVTINTDGTVTYTPNANYNGTDTFTYTISDGNSGTATATVTVVIDPVNDAPVAVDDNDTTLENTPVVVNVLENDSDIDGDKLTVTAVTQGANGKVTINTDGTVTYTPNANYNGTDTFTYTISDGNGGTATATVTVVIDPVNDAPVAFDDNDTTLEKTPVVINVLANDSDIDGDTLTVTAVTQGANGKVTINTDGTVTYTPNANFNGTDTFTYTISDGNGGTATATVTVVIDPVNDAPVAVDDNDTTLENTPVVINVLANDSDIDGDKLTVTAVTQGANGKVTINTDGTVTYTPNANYNGTDTFTYTISDGNGGTATATVTVVIDPVNDAPVAVDDNDTTLENTPVVINVLSNDSDIDGDTLTVTTVTQGANGKVTINTDGTVTYTPNASFNGTDTFTYTISDGNGGTATATVTVVIDPVNDAPVAVDDNDTTLENTPVVINVLSNDSDIDGDKLTVTEVTQGANGKVTINTDGTVTYTPNASFNGTDTFTYTISDGNGGTATATVRVVIDPVNDAPVAVDDNDTTLENTPVVINVLANDSDIDGDKLSVTEVTQGANGKVTINTDGTVTYTPNASFNGTDTFTYTISDGNGGTATATVTVVIDPVNDAPVAVDDNESTLENTHVVINVLSNDSDIDGDKLFVTEVTQGANGKVTINTDGTVTYTPNANFNGTDTFTYTISDGNGGTATATVTVVIDHVNNAPIAVDDSARTSANTPVAINVLENDSDIDGDTLAVTEVTQGANGNVNINTDGTVTYTPNANYNGTDIFTYTISDGNGGTATATVIVVIDRLNNAPIAVDDSARTSANTPVAIRVLANDSDIDGDTLTVTEVTQGANGKVTINTYGTVTYTPNANYNGTDTFTYTISDGNGGTATATVTVIIDAAAGEYATQWETAWGGWQTSKGFEKFDKKSNPAGAVVVDNVTRSGSSAWSMAIIFDGTEKTVDLVRGQYEVVGSVTVKADGKGNLVVIYNVDAGYVLGDIHCGAYAKLSDLNVGNGKLNGNDKINGNTVTIPYAGGTVYVGAHCETGKVK